MNDAVSFVHRRNFFYHHNQIRSAPNALHGERIKSFITPIGGLNLKYRIRVTISTQKHYAPTYLAGETSSLIGGAISTSEEELSWISATPYRSYQWIQFFLKQSRLIHQNQAYAVPAPYGKRAYY